MPCYNHWIYSDKALLKEGLFRASQLLSGPSLYNNTNTFTFHFYSHSDIMMYWVVIPQQSLVSDQTRHLQGPAKNTQNKHSSCAACDWSSEMSKEMKTHMLQQHKGKRSHSCSQCDYSSINASCLKSHMLVHSGEKPFSCAQCEHSSKTAADLKKHTRMHSGEKPFSCKQCNYSSTQKVNL